MKTSNPDAPTAEEQAFWKQCYIKAVENRLDPTRVANTALKDFRKLYVLGAVRS